jgi:hypothetical protein
LLTLSACLECKVVNGDLPDAKDRLGGALDNTDCGCHAEVVVVTAGMGLGMSTDITRKKSFQL